MIDHLIVKDIGLRRWLADTTGCTEFDVGRALFYPRDDTNLLIINIDHWGALVRIGELPFHTSVYGEQVLYQCVVSVAGADITRRAALAPGDTSVPIEGQSRANERQSEGDMPAVLTAQEAMATSGFTEAPQYPSMPTYMTMVDANEREYQNPQELLSIWGTIQDELETFDASLTSTHVMLGGYDFHLVFDAADRQTAFQVTQVIERHGLTTQTMPAMPIDQVGDLVDDR
jgi:uncharacterized protein with GYD domain